MNKSLRNVWIVLGVLVLPIAIVGLVLSVLVYTDNFPMGRHIRDIESRPPNETIVEGDLSLNGGVVAPLLALNKQTANPPSAANQGLMFADSSNRLHFLTNNNSDKLLVQPYVLPLIGWQALGPSSVTFASGISNVLINLPNCALLRGSDTTPVGFALESKTGKTTYTGSKSSVVRAVVSLSVTQTTAAAGTLDFFLAINNVIVPANGMSMTRFGFNSSSTNVLRTGEFSEQINLKSSDVVQLCAHADIAGTLTLNLYRVNLTFRALLPYTP